MKPSASNKRPNTIDEARKHICCAIERRMDAERERERISSEEQHKALIDTLMTVCALYPSLAVERFTFYVCGALSTAFTPLEYMILGPKVSFQIMKAFCISCPEALSVQNLESKEFPLHLICRDFRKVMPYSGDLVQFIANQFPKAVSVVNNEGLLPLHILLKQGLHHEQDKPSLVQEGIKAIDALVQFFPQSLDCLCSSQSRLPGRTRHFTAIDLVLSHRSPFVESIQDCIVRHLATMETISLRFGLYALTGSGASRTLESLIKSEHLSKLHVILYPSSLKKSRSLRKCILDALPDLVTLLSLKISFDRKAEQEMMIIADQNNMPSVRWELQLAEPLAELLYSGSLEELIVEESQDLAIHPAPILQAIVNNPDSGTLQTLNIQCFDSSYDMTDLLANTIAVRSNLKNLSISNITFGNHRPIFEALAGNRRLHSLALPNIIISSLGNSNGCIPNEEEYYERLSKVLQKHNVTLCHILCHGASSEELASSEYQAIQYYALLNHYGRSDTRQEQFDNQKFVKLLMRCDYHKDEMLGVSYGLLRECPSVWASSSVCNY